MLSKPEELSYEADAWITQQSDLRKLWLSLEISKGRVWGLTLSCEKGPTRWKSTYALDVIVVIQKNLASAFSSLFTRPNVDALMDGWMQAHPNARVITQRIVTSQGMPSEAWILYRT